jgi:hypothetical protein
MKKSAKGSKTKKPAAGKATGKKSAPKPAAGARPTKKVAAPEARSVSEARYTPPPLRADGWGPFRYPPQ